MVTAALYGRTVTVELGAKTESRPPQVTQDAAGALPVALDARGSADPAELGALAGGCVLPTLGGRRVTSGAEPAGGALAGGRCPTR